jgi:hypothetical protein
MGTKIKIVIGVALVAVIAIVAVTLLVGGDDDDSKSAGDKTSKSADKGDKKSSDDADDSSDEPELRTLAVKRSKGRDAAVNVGALTRKPGKIALRVSAAPKQKVTVNWTLACGVGATAQGDYEVTPPDTRELKLPKKNPRTCVASASSQIDGEGRLKLAVMRDR